MSSHHRNNLEHRLHSGKCHWIWHLVCMTLVALIMAACAPGTGGTGTGPITSSANLSSSESLVFTSATASTGAVPITTGTVSFPLPSTNSFAGLSPCTLSVTPTVPSLLMSELHIKYQQDCYAFRYQGSWDFDSALNLTVKGAVFNINEPERQQTALLSLVASSSLNSESVTIRVTITDPTSLTSLPAQILQPTK
jgi:hypothetical protein